MNRRFLTIALLAIGATFSRAQPALPSSFQAKTIHSPEAADIFMRWGGKGPVVVLIHGYAENSDSRGNLFWGYLAAAALMIAAAAVEAVLGVNAEKKPLEDITEPLSAVDNHVDAQALEAID